MSTVSYRTSVVPSIALLPHYELNTLPGGFEATGKIAPGSGRVVVTSYASSSGSEFSSYDKFGFFEQIQKRIHASWYSSRKMGA